MKNVVFMDSKAFCSPLFPVNSSSASTCCQSSDASIRRQMLRYIRRLDLGQSDLASWSTWPSAARVNPFADTRWDSSRPCAWDTMRHHWRQFVIWKWMFQVKLILFRMHKYLRIIFYCFDSKAEHDLWIQSFLIFSFSLSATCTSSCCVVRLSHGIRVSSEHQFARQFIKHTNISPTMHAQRWWRTTNSKTARSLRANVGTRRSERW